MNKGDDHDLSKPTLSVALALHTPVSAVLGELGRGAVSAPCCAPCCSLSSAVCCRPLLQASRDVAAYLWQAVSRMEFLSVSGTDAMDTGMLA